LAARFTDRAGTTRPDDGGGVRQTNRGETEKWGKVIKFAGIRELHAAGQYALELTCSE
jgi:hypothetical protein